MNSACSSWRTVWDLRLALRLTSFTCVPSTCRNVTKRFKLLKEFKPPRWSRGPLFQLYCAIACPTPKIDYKPEVLRLRDGGSVVLDWSHRPSKAPGAPVAIILPGIGVPQPSAHMSTARCRHCQTATVTFVASSPSLNTEVLCSRAQPRTLCEANGYRAGEAGVGCGSL